MKPDLSPPREGQYLFAGGELNAVSSSCSTQAAASHPAQAAPLKGFPTGPLVRFVLLMKLSADMCNV